MGGHIRLPGGPITVVPWLLSPVGVSQRSCFPHPPPSKGAEEGGSRRARVCLPCMFGLDGLVQRIAMCRFLTVYLSSPRSRSRPTLPVRESIQSMKTPEGVKVCHAFNCRLMVSIEGARARRGERERNRETQPLAGLEMTYERRRQS